MFNNFNLTIKRNRIDILTAGVLCIVFSYACFQGARLVPEVLTSDNARDVWFEGDINRVYDTMTFRGSEYNFRSESHPLFSLFVHPAVFFLEKALHFHPMTAVRLLVSLVAFFWMLLLFALLRLLGLRRLDSVLCCMLAALSAASVFWFVVPESFSFGSLGIICALLVAALSMQYELSTFWFVLMNLASASFVLTNWMAGVFSTFLSVKLRHALRIMAYTLSILTVLWGVQKFIYPGSRMFIGNSSQKEFMFNPETGGPSCIIPSFLYHTIIMPSFQTVSRNPETPEWPIMVTQYSSIGSGGLWGLAAVLIWSILLGLGLWALLRLRALKRFRVCLGLILLGQFCLYLVFGEETFLYSLNSIALLIPLAALSFLTRARKLAIVLACLLIPCLAINNIHEFRKAINSVEEQASKAAQFKVQQLHQAGKIQVTDRKPKWI